MIKDLSIRNYRSIHECDITLSDSGLNILIGANGTGKSNLVKCLEFISNLSSGGVEYAVSSQGGYNSILPKATSFEPGAMSSIRYKEYPVRPDKLPDVYDDPYAEHSIDVKWTKKNRFIVSSEELSFNEPLAIGEIMRKSNVMGDSPDDDFNSPASSVSFKRKRGRLDCNLDFNLDNENSKSFLHWLGLSYILRHVDSDKEVSDIIEGIVGLDSDEPFKEQKEGRETESIMEWDEAGFRFSNQVGKLISNLNNITRFDIQLSELRSEQRSQQSKKLTSSGSNFPTSIDWVKNSDDEDISWNRIMEHLTTIAPHIESVGTERLKTGREYIQFIESEVGRPVESWDSSDGTLRALAVMVALETHPEDGTVIIEEPELGLHPWAIDSLMDHMREVVQEKRIQVLLTTHSRQILENASPKEVYVTSRKPGRGTSIKPMRKMKEARNLVRGEIGRQWVKGLFGGVPS